MDASQMEDGSRGHSRRFLQLETETKDINIKTDDTRFHNVDIYKDSKYLNISLLGLN